MIEFYVTSPLVTLHISVSGWSCELVATNGPLNASQLTIDGGYLVAVALPLHLIFENHNSRASLLKTCLNL